MHHYLVTLKSEITAQSVTVYIFKIANVQENYMDIKHKYKKLSYCWETVRRESMPRIAEMDVEMTT